MHQTPPLSRSRGWISNISKFAMELYPSLVGEYVSIFIGYSCPDTRATTRSFPYSPGRRREAQSWQQVLLILSERSHSGSWYWWTGPGYVYRLGVAPPYSTFLLSTGWRSASNDSYRYPFPSSVQSPDLLIRFFTFLVFSNESDLRFDTQIEKQSSCCVSPPKEQAT